MKIQLPSVTLLIADCVNVAGAINVLEHCKSLCDFGAVKLLTNFPTDYPDRVKIKPLNSLIAYSVFMLTKVHNYIETDRVLIVQRDGFILNASSWEDLFLTFDFIGPLFVQYPLVGSGGFSLRSKRIMEHMAAVTPEWDWSQRHAEEIQSKLFYYEDGEICFKGHQSKFKFPSAEEAGRFAQGGNPDPKFFNPKPFGFHGVVNAIDHTTGVVKPVCEHGGSTCECVQPHLDHLLKMSK